MGIMKKVKRPCHTIITPLSTVSGWFIGGIAGLSNASPGWRHILINPKVNGSLTHASGQTSTPYGLVKSSWEKTSGQVNLDIEIPAGTSGSPSGI